MTSPIGRSAGLYRAAPIKAQGKRKISTPDPAPNAFVLTIALPIPVSGSRMRAASGCRFATAGTATKNGVDRNVRKAGAILSAPTAAHR